MILCKIGFIFQQGFITFRKGWVLQFRWYRNGYYQNRSVILFWTVCLQWMELLKFCHWRITRSGQVSIDQISFLNLLMKNIASYEFDRLCYMSYSISQESPKSNCNLLHISNSSLCIDQCGFLHDVVCTRSSWFRSSCSGNLRNIT